MKQFVNKKAEYKASTSQYAGHPLLPVQYVSSLLPNMAFIQNNLQISKMTKKK